MSLVEFKKWLIEQKGFHKKTASDIASRVRRVNKIFNQENLISDIKKFEVEINRLDSSVYIKSQLKRAYYLYIEYKSLNK